jgi:hypothetical protein
MVAKKIDFLVVGTAKSGTTTLHELIKNHPQISVPKAKEVPFFNDDELYKKGLDWYLKQHFNKTNHKSRWGTVTPQYTYYRGGHSPASTAKRIKQTLPNVKIAVILRHPIERTFSHFKTSVRRSNETRTFEEAIQELLSDPKKLAKDRQKEWTSSNLFLFASEYGKVLDPYFKEFGKSNVLVLYFEDLKENPGKVLNEFFRFIGVRQNYKPNTIRKQYNAGGMKPKVGLLTPKYLYRVPGLRKTWRTIIPYKIRKLIEVNVNSWNAKKDNEKLDKSSVTYKKLCKHFKPEITKLKKRPGARRVWSDIV